MKTAYKPYSKGEQVLRKWGLKIHITNDELMRRFNYHQPTTEEKVERHQRVREACRAAAQEIVEVTGPPTREQSLAITHLEEAMFWGNAALAREL